MEEIERHCGDLARVRVAVANGQARDDHVGVADRLHLVHVEVGEDLVEHGVQVVEKLHDLDGRAECRDGGEADDVAEVDGDTVERLGLHS